MSQSPVRLSTNFLLREFHCRNGVHVPTSATSALRRWCAVWGEPLRREFGPVRVTSGYRTPVYNRQVGGAPDSFHVYDRRHPAKLPGANLYDVAVDVEPARGTPAQWERWAVARMGTAAWGMGPRRGAAVAYPSSRFIHLDTGPRRTWAG